MSEGCTVQLQLLRRSLLVVCMTGVFGTLDLFGQPHNVYHTKLASTANAGTKTLTLKHSVDWQVNLVYSYLCNVLT